MITNKKDIPVSACLIVQDEERYIEKTLENLYHNVSEIIIVDGGSKDKTLEICEKYGCKIFHRSFDFDFSAQRNFAQKQCSKQWVLWCDADEYFSEDFFMFLPTIVMQIEKDVAAIKVYRKSIFDGELKGEEYQYRLVNRDLTSWIWPIHENIQYNTQKYREINLPKACFMIHEHTMDRQLYNNSLYFNINNKKFIRPEYNKGCEHNGTEWISKSIDRDK